MNGGNRWIFWMSSKWNKIQKTVINTELCQSVWRNLDLDLGTDLTAFGPVLTTSVKIPPYILQANITNIFLRESGKTAQLSSSYFHQYHISCSKHFAEFMIQPSRMR